MPTTHVRRSSIRRRAREGVVNAKGALLLLGAAPCLREDVTLVGELNLEVGEIVLEHLFR